MRWLHIYLSMFSFVALLFFAVTGVTLNHPDWFYDGAERTRDVEGELPLGLLGGDAPRTAEGMEVDRLGLVEALRSRHQVRGALAELRIDEYECSVAFKGPGYAADALVDRETGAYELTETLHGFVAIINDLHKGRDSGSGWSWLIDVSAILMVLVSVTGLLLLLFLRHRRVSGLVVTLVGGVVVVAVWWLAVP